MNNHKPAHRKNGEHSRHHPHVAQLIAHHDQSDWTITTDGLICAPVGFYRIMELYEDNSLESPPTKTLVFGFQPQDLDLVSHPQHPDRMILKKTAYILPPVENDYVTGWAEIAMRDHQGKWLDFALGYSNLYLTAKGQDEYLSNKFVAYRLFPTYDAAGNTTGYNVSFRINPFRRSYGAGLLEQDKKRTPADFLWHRGVVLQKNIATREQALHFIRQDFHDRYMSFLKGEEVQRWSDPEKFQTVAMWLGIRASDMHGKPLSLANIISKMLGSVLKFKPAAIIADQGLDILGESARRESLHENFGEIAEVSEDSPAPLSSMRSDIRKRCIAIAPENVRPQLLPGSFSHCSDMAARYCNRLLDFVHSLTPTLIHTDATATTILSHHGIRIHRLHGPAPRVYVTYAPRLAVQNLPAAFKPLFREGHIAEIELGAGNRQLISGQ